MIKKRDEHARSVRTFNILSEAPHSVLSDRSLDEIAADPDAVWKDGRSQALKSSSKRSKKTKRNSKRSKPAAPVELPDFAAIPKAKKARQPTALKPQLAQLARTAPTGKDWLHEIKLDGYRLMTVMREGEARLLTRNGHDWTDKFPDVARALGRFPVSKAIIDGEVCVLNTEGISDFQALQNAFRGYTRAPFIYYVFDLPYIEGFDLRSSPLEERKKALAAIVHGAPLAAPTVQYCDHIVGKGPTVFREAARSGLEGIISKRADAPYESRRVDHWLKVKCTKRQEFVVGGYTTPSGSRSGFGALLIGCHDEGGRLIYHGRVGTGFTEQMLEDIRAQLDDIAADEPPFVNPEKDPEAKAINWVAPSMVVEVEFGQWTNDNLVRHATFRGLRADRDASGIQRESTPESAPGTRAPSPKRKSTVIRKTSGGVKSPHSPADAILAGVRISNPQRIVYPEEGVTKLEVAEYYAAAAEWILPFIAKRPLSLVRCPVGLAGESFYQRQVGEGFPKSIRGITVHDEDAIVIDDINGLLSLIQMGVLEIHPWGSREDKPDRPDQIIFDLDPGPGIEWEDVIASAKFIRDYLDDLGLVSFVKTTGGRGLHLVAPITRRAEWPAIKNFSHAVAKQIVSIAPRNFVATMTKSRRENRIFIDYLRNLRGSTAVGAYSTRARDGATVSTPLRWNELSPKSPPGDFNVLTVPKRLAQLKSDPWDGYHTTRQSITAAMKKAVGIRE